MIRPARLEDAAQAAPLLTEVYGDLAHTLLGADDADEARRVIAGFFRQSGSRLSCENALVSETNGEVVGILICYHGSRDEALTRPLTAHLAARTGNPAAIIPPEARPDEFYLDVLCVRADHRGRGVGTDLIRAFEALGRAQGYQTLALLADKDIPAYRLYVRLGYDDEDSVLLGGHEFRHLVKRLGA